MLEAQLSQRTTVLMMLLLFCAEELMRFATVGRPKLRNKRAFPDVRPGLPADVSMAADIPGTTAFVGTQPNASPSVKQRSKKSKLLARVGLRPNPTYLAMTENDLTATRNYERMTSYCDLSSTAESVMCMEDDERRELMLNALPQRSDLWLQLRAQYVTGTSLSTMSGFNEQCSVDMLLGSGKKPYLVDHCKAEH